MPEKTPDDAQISLVKSGAALENCSISLHQGNLDGVFTALREAVQYQLQAVKGLANNQRQAMDNLETAQNLITQAESKLHIGRYQHYINEIANVILSALEHQRAIVSHALDIQDKAREEVIHGQY